MKNITTKFIGLVVALVTCVGFTSCEWDEDAYESSVITGEWEGDFGMFYDWYCRRCRDYHTYYAEESRVKFFPDHSGATHGYGYQTDFYMEGPYRHQNYYFEWELIDGVLSLYYPYDSNLDVDIFKYHMTRNTFSGRFGHDGEHFSLYKVTDYYDWSPFYDDDCYYYYDERYSWHSVANKACVADDEDMGYVVKRGRCCHADVE